MNLRGIANAVSSVVNPNTIVTVRRSIGYTKALTGQKQIPLYAPGVTGPAQLQALSAQDVQQIEGLNIQGVPQVIYLRGKLAGVIRPNQVGGDLVMIGTGTWLVVKVLEQWQDWVKAVIVLQGD